MKMLRGLSLEGVEEEGNPYVFNNLVPFPFTPSVRRIETKKSH
jgi:hypothetical protein